MQRIAVVAAPGRIIGRTTGGAVVIPAALDYVAWTERIGRFTQRDDLKAPERTAWLSGADVAPRPEGAPGARLDGPGELHHRGRAVALRRASSSDSPSRKETKMAEQAQKKPNMLIIWGDDIGQSNVSAYSKGMMGYRTPNIDRIAQ